MGGKTTINTSDTKIEALKLQSSAYGVVVPVVGGTTRIAGNLVYYNDFKAIAHTTSQSSGKGGGVKTTQTTYTYQASVIMGLCQGPISGLGRIWVGKKRYDQAWVQPPTQTLVDHLTLPATLPYTYTLAASDVSGVTQVRTDTGIDDVPLAEGADYTVNLAAGTITFKEGFPGGEMPSSWAGWPIAITYTKGFAPYAQTSAQQLGITVLNGWDEQVAPSWVTQLHLADAIGYAYQAVAYAQDYQLGSGAQIENHTFEVMGFGAYAISPSVPDCNPADFTRALLTNGRYGARMPAGALDSFALWSNYCLAAGIVLSPALTTQTSAADFITTMGKLTNSEPVWSVNKLKMVPYGDTALVGNGGSYTPNLTPAYDLTDDQFLAKEGEPPVAMTRNSRSDRYNNVKVQFQNRNNYYNKEVAEFKDDADISVNGLRTMQDVQGDWICDPAVAQTVATLLVQRSLNVVSTYQFKLAWAFCMLEPMDLVTLTDADLGLNKALVRITQIDEDEHGTLTVTAESFSAGVASVAQYQLQQALGYKQNYNVSPQPVAVPAIFEMPVALTKGGLGVYVAACAQSGDTLWGGCRVWLSLDGGNYQQVGTITGGSRIGHLAQAMAAGDTSLRVQLDGAGGQIATATSAAAAANQSLLWVDGPQGGEYMDHTVAALNATNDYTLTVARGAYLNPANAHAAGARFVRVDSTVLVRDDLDLSFIGKTLYFKFTSFNVFGAGEQSLADVPAYTYTIAGGQAQLPPPSPSNLQIAGLALSWTTVSWPDLAGYRVRMQFGVNTDWGSAIPLHTGTIGSTPFLLQSRPGGVVTLMVRAVDTLGNESTGTAAAIANLGDLLVSNIFETWPQAPTFPGNITNGAVSAGVLRANSTSNFWLANTAAAFWTGNSSLFWPAQSYAQMQYQFQIQLDIAGTVLLDTIAVADSVALEYQRGDQSSFWGAVGANLFWPQPVQRLTFWPPFTPSWQTWIGSLPLLAKDVVIFRATLSGGQNQGSITRFTPQLDVPDITETVQNAAIAAGGTRLPITKSYHAIKNVNCSIQVDGNGGVNVRIVDYSTSGPLVQVVNSVGVAVAGTINATIEGY